MKFGRKELSWEVACYAKGVVCYFQVEDHILSNFVICQRWVSPWCKSLCFRTTTLQLVRPTEILLCQSRQMVACALPINSSHLLQRQRSPL